ncbi:hypothetical protein POTOM_042746 [Populus tomentosa]|uniref:Uncharacterized protein n=1 Tax=Populus tomentosa TaxID=118781 RepID=A0A8X7YX82_POPTO|nr:hypothetical protein POTOM_042746 [Populus tomentosa]
MDYSYNNEFFALFSARLLLCYSPGKITTFLSAVGDLKKSPDSSTSTFGCALKGLGPVTKSFNIEIRQMAGGSGSASTSIDIEELLKDFPDRMKTTLPEEMCIYHVPVDIRQVNKDAYTPLVICIGPIHQKNENQVMKELKRRYFKQFLNRLRVVEEGKLLEELVKTITDRVDEIRNCYEDAAYELCKDPKGCELKIHNCYEDAAFEPRKDPKGCEVEILDCSEDDSSKRCEDQKVFWKMILWDAVFIFELFLKNREFEEYKHKSQDQEDTEEYQKNYKQDYIIAKPWLRSAVQRDLILLENQLPFFILQVLYGIVSKYNITGYFCPPKTSCSCLPETDKTCCSCLPETDCCCPCIAFRELTCTFFMNYNKNKTSPEKPLHFTDLVRSFFLPKDLHTKYPNPKDPRTKDPNPKVPRTKDSNPKVQAGTIKNLHRATRLHQAGMKFKPKNPVEYNIRSWKEVDSIKKADSSKLLRTISGQEDHIRRCYAADSSKLLRTISGQEDHIRRCYAADSSKLLSTISGQEDHICRCYAADSSKLTGDQFVKMVLLDAVFIFELFLRNEEYLGDNSKYQDDFIIGQPWLRAAIRRDLILLENQLPFSTLNDLYDCAMSKTDCKSFVDLSCRYFDKYKKNSRPSEKILHFTDLVRCFLSFKHPDLKSDQKAEPIKTLYSATMLHQAGIKFKPLANVSLLDIRAWKPLSKDQTPLSDKKGRKRIFLEDYDYTMGNLGISLLFQEIEGYRLRNHSSNLNRIAVLRSDPVGESLPSQNW